MKVVGKMFKRESYQDQKGQAKERCVLLDMTPDGVSSEQFFEIPSETCSAKIDEFVEFNGRFLFAKGARAFFMPETGSVKVLKVKSSEK